MHLTIISGASRSQAKSNTAKIIASFCTGYQSKENSVEIWYLSDRRQWNGARNAFQHNTIILFALPLYVENIPGIMLEFLQSLPYKTLQGTKISFLLQGGFPEASQSRCCERFLKTLPEKLGCEYGGTLIRGDMFGVGLLGDRIGAKMLQPFISIGRCFSKYGYFDQNTILEFTSPEYLTEKQQNQSNQLGKHLQNWVLGRIAKKLGCKEKLDAKPYALFLSSDLRENHG